MYFFLLNAMLLSRSSFTLASRKITAGHLPFERLLASLLSVVVAVAFFSADTLFLLTILFLVLLGTCFVAFMIWGKGSRYGKKDVWHLSRPGSLSIASLYGVISPSDKQSRGRQRTSLLPHSSSSSLLPVVKIAHLQSVVSLLSRFFTPELLVLSLMIKLMPVWRRLA